ncbi:unnamed protein product [Camellia sinensis]
MLKWLCVRKVGFASSRVESQTDGGIKVAANHEDIEPPDGSLKQDEADNDSNGDDTAKDKDSDAHLDALERIKRKMRGGWAPV